jgi:phosphatidate cytidylyltransferase
MQPALRNRLIFGTLMLIALGALLALDHFIEQWTVGWHVRRGQPHGIGGVGLLALLLLALPLATMELAALFARLNVAPYRGIAATGSGMLAIHAFLTQFEWFQPYGASTMAFIIVFVMLFAALRRAWGRQSQQAITLMAGTVLATLYFGGLGWFMLALRVKQASGDGAFRGSTAVIIMILLVVKFTDIGAFFGGKLFGRHKLIPWLSPGKTWEGLAAGLLVAGAMAALWAPIIQPLTVYQAIVIGVLLGGIGQLGDLLESLMKRDAEVKDSGSTVPGFGGVLDITDSPLLAGPFAYLLFSLL